MESLISIQHAKWHWLLKCLYYQKNNTSIKRVGWGGPRRKSCQRRFRISITEFRTEAPLGSPPQSRAVLLKFVSPSTCMTQDPTSIMNQNGVEWDDGPGLCFLGRGLTVKPCKSSLALPSRLVWNNMFIWPHAFIKSSKVNNVTTNVNVLSFSTLTSFWQVLLERATERYLG